jgi:hypothetical protein
VRIEQPTSDPAWTTEDATIDLAGSADHDTTAIDAVTWDVLAGPTGTATGTTAWSAAAIPLADGTNLIRVIASAPTLHDDYGGHTTFNDTLRVIHMGPPPEPGTVVAAINAGGDAYTAIDGTPYLADSGFSGGSTQVSNVEVAGTDDDVLYNNWRFGDFAYHLPVFPGIYTVELHFADTYNSTPGQRLFNVSIEGATVLQEFDIIAVVGVNTALVRTFDVDVSDGVLDIALSNGSAGNARLDALRVIRAGDAGESIFADGFEAD